MYRVSARSASKQLVQGHGGILRYHAVPPCLSLYKKAPKGPRGRLGGGHFATSTSSSRRGFSSSTRLKSAATVNQGDKDNMYDAVVVGGGPAGIAVLGNILDRDMLAKVLWIDPEFNGGRLKKYVDVSSNTKVSLFLQYAHAVEPFLEIVRSTPKPNAITDLEGLDADAGCRLGYAHRMLLMLTDGLKRLPTLDTRIGTIVDADLNTQSSMWSIKTQTADSSSTIHDVQSRRLILCSGSSPTTRTIDVPNLTLKNVDLDTALDRAKLRTTIPVDQDTTIGVIGSSHSAIVLIMNLYELATSTHPRMKIKWFTRRPLSYAVYMDGWILRDNTGLKGASADFARAHLEDDKLLTKSSPVSRFLEKVDCSADEDGAFHAHLPQCTHLVQAIGYRADPMPDLRIDGRPVENLGYDASTGLFHSSPAKGNSATAATIPGLSGAGIAFPERVVDPAGNTEHAVGLWKFMRYLKTVVPEHWAIGREVEVA